jgi:hypothetical protein
VQEQIADEAHVVDAPVVDAPVDRSVTCLNNAYLTVIRFFPGFMTIVRRTIGTLPRDAVDNTEIGRKLAILLELDPTFDERQLLHCFRCPINDEVMRDPKIVCESRQTYDRRNIQPWFRRSNIDPLSGRRLHSTAMIDNLGIKQGIIEELDRRIAIARNNAQPEQAVQQPELRLT